MRTLAEISLAVARIVTPDNIVTGSATAGSTTSLTDTQNLTQQQQYFDKGTLWMLSGDNAGAVLRVTGHNGNKVTFNELQDTVEAGDRYAVARNLYPWEQIKAAINQALNDTHVEAVDESLIGDGETLEFTLPAGVYDVKRVWIKHPTDASGMYDSRSTHWRQQSGKLKFDFGYAPRDDYKISITYRETPADLVDADDVLSDEINPDWLRYKAAEYLLNWGMGAYGTQAEYRIEERMGFVLERLKRLTARMDINIEIRTAGA